MFRLRPRATSLANALAGVLVFALLSAQWAGLSHRIEHNDRMQHQHAATSAATSQQQEEPHNHEHHSCIAFDAATLSATLHSVACMAPYLPNTHIAMPWIGFLSRTAPLRLHFSSRAPPFLD